MTAEWSRDHRHRRTDVWGRELCGEMSHLSTSRGVHLWSREASALDPYRKGIRWLCHDVGGPKREGSLPITVELL